MENELSDERGSKTKAAPGLEPGRLSVIYWLSDGLACEPQSRSQIFNLRRVILTLGSGGSLHMSIDGMNDKYINGEIGHSHHPKCALRQNVAYANLFYILRDKKDSAEFSGVRRE